MNLTHFEKLNAINVNDKTEVKDNGQVKLTYLSWAWAWQECKKQFPDASYEIEKFEIIYLMYMMKTQDIWCLQKSQSKG